MHPNCFIPDVRPLTAVDHSLATELVMGVLRWRSLLDSQIAGSSAQPLSKLDLEILTALRLAVYQLRWLSRIPARAAINESVELVKRARKRSAAPFVNAVLRKLANGISPSSEVSPPAVSGVSPRLSLPAVLTLYGSSNAGSMPTASIPL
jgi:transcription termination factor NusB